MHREGLKGFNQLVITINISSDNVTIFTALVSEMHYISGWIYIYVGLVLLYSLTP